MVGDRYPIGSAEDFILNTLPIIVVEWGRFLNVSQSFLRDWQLDLQLVASGTADASEVAEGLQSKLRELQSEVLNALKATQILGNMVDTLCVQLKKRLE